jgi:transcriptional regulator with XRE-family HTH domain
MASLYSDKLKIVTATRLKSLRKERGLSHVALRNELEKKCKLEVSKDSLIKFEVSEDFHSSFGATKGMKAETLFCLAKFYNVSVDYLLGNTDIRSQNPDVKIVCGYTGLSEEAVSSLWKLKRLFPSGYIPADITSNNPSPSTQILNLLFEKGFIPNVVDLFDTYLIHMAKLAKNRSDPSFENELGVDTEVVVDWHLNSEITALVKEAKGLLEDERLNDYLDMEDWA